MKRRLYIRLLILIVAASMSFILFSYSRSRASTDEDANGGDSGKCPQKKAQTEYILWESLTHNLLSASH
jgi:hypothetical protein